MNNKHIKFGDYLFVLIPDGVILGESGGTIVFHRGDMTLDEIKEILQKNNTIAQIDVLGETEWSREDLIYAGKLTNQSGYVINTEQALPGGNEYMAVDVKADVMIAEFRKPDVREEIVVLKEDNTNLLKKQDIMQGTIDILILSSLEG